MSTENDNGQSPAFPLEFDGKDFKGNKARLRNYGLTKREYFAAMVLQGMAASQYWAENFTEIESDLEKATKVATKAADALLNQLNQSK